ncbi:hypothetical protein HP567_028760 [Brevibacillus sp. M2.1A]|uniref:hypothetical protein n=1 Tax=Brevibacillus sp. M2.1A TaxID=2738980 RepID=UPI00156B4DB5|nr:hypothetical protein [Brevibacillus sp. M2.1A]MCC8438530.1 hypothetical protein [Brevibacillus sp. M2.1A]
MAPIKSQIAKGLITLAITAVIPFTFANSSFACGELSFKDGQYSQVTSISSVKYQEGTGRFFFITKGENNFWVLDIKEEAFTKKRMDYYNKMYTGQKLRINFKVSKNDIGEITYQLLK